MSAVRKRPSDPVEGRPPYWMQQWLVHHRKSGRFDGHEYRIYDIHKTKGPPLSSACAEGVISRIGDTALELRESESAFSGYAIWFGLLAAAPMVALLFYADMPQSLWGALLALCLVCMGLCAVAFGALWIFATFKELLVPTRLSVGFLFDRLNQRLWWHDGMKEQWVAWDRIRVVHRPGFPGTESVEALRLLVLDKDDSLVCTSPQGTKPLAFTLPAWRVGHRCTRSHDPHTEARKAVLDFIAVFMRDGRASLPATRWRTPAKDRERLFLDLAHTLDFFAGPRASTSRNVRAFCAVLMALAAPFLLPPQWMHALAEFRRQPGEWSSATLHAVGIDPGSPTTRLAAPAGSRSLHAPLDREQRTLAWIWIATAFATYFIIGWKIVH
ncbi:hypothetical protein [Variovorax paradoxus]|uniref:hypothetical protein n=1 Tax=Variovorax paradoxus TaxID=34073 RepID=UPI003ECF8C2F